MTEKTPKRARPKAPRKGSAGSDSRAEKAAVDKAAGSLPRATGTADIQSGALQSTALAPPELTDLDSALLESCRTKWQHGAWHDLIIIKDEAIAQDPERAKLALLLAVAHHHSGNPARSRGLAKQAIEWGADRRTVARILISAACNDLGRAAQCLDESRTAATHFTEALRLVEPRADVGLLARTRQWREAASLGLLSEAVGMFDTELRQMQGKPDRSEDVERLRQEVAILRQDIAKQSKPAAPDPEAARGSARLMTGTQPETAVDFHHNRRFSYGSHRMLSEQDAVILLELKSLPRAGLHYAEGSVTGIMRDAASFCEWYQEPGCCRRMPCDHCCYVPDRDRDASIHLRMVKSHDFDLADPRYPPAPQLRRLILVRDPLFILTSWWCLDLLTRHRDALQAVGINPVSLFFRHNRSMLTAAYQALDDVTLDCAPEAVSQWIEQRRPYILGFTDKWVADTGNRISPYQQVVRYPDVPRTIAALLNDLSDRLCPQQRMRLERYADARESPFRPREDAFLGPTQRITAELQSCRAIFEAAADKMRAEDGTGTLDWAAGP